MVIILQIVVKNFKSFKDEHVVDGLMGFTAVVGPNGSGKSNFADAICFAMGAKAARLRVGRVAELVCQSSPAGSPINMSVSAVLRASDGTEVKLQRSFTGSTVAYCINNNMVPYKDYMECLKRIHINPLVNDFVVFQDSVDSILRMSPKERAAVFEEISGSKLLAAEYKRLSTSVAQHKQKFDHYLKARKLIQSKIKAVQVSKNNADQYQSLKKELAEEQITLTLFDLLGIERFLEASTIESKRMSTDIERLARRKSELEETLSVAVQRVKEEKYKTAAVEREVKTMEDNSVELLAKVMKHEAAIEFARSRIASSREAYASALNADKARKRTIEELQEVLLEVERNKNEYVSRFGETFETGLKLRAPQVEEYEKLKDCFVKTCASDFERLASLERSCGPLEDKFYRERQIAEEVEDARARQETFAHATRERHYKLETARDAKQRELEEQRKLYHNLRLKYRELKKQEKDLTRQIEEVDNVYLDGVEVRKIRQRTISIESLRQYSHGVYDRLGKMYEPIHKRYSLATSTVLGPHVNSIIVDTMVTAVRCTDYLKATTFGSETFLPLDSLKVKPLETRLRNLKAPAGVKLLYDVIKCEPATISQAVLYVTGNTLVSETTEDAYKIAANPKTNRQYDCASIQDGIYFMKSGPIAGGVSDVSTELRRYDSEEQTTLLMRKKAMTSTLRAVRQNILSAQRELSDIAKMKCLDDSVQWLNDALKNLSREQYDDVMAMSGLEDKLDDLKSTLRNDQDALEAVKQEIEAVRSRIQAEENRIFADFCQRIGIDDIRQYENAEEEYEKNVQNFDDQIDRLRQQLQFEMSRKTAIELRKKHLADSEAMLQSALEEKESYIRGPEYKNIMKRIEHLESTNKNLMRTIKTIELKITQLRALTHDVSEEYQTKTIKLNQLTTAIQKYKEKRHDILVEARIKALKIPMIDGPEAEISDGDDPDSTPTFLEESSDTYEGENIKFDYAKLPPRLLTLERSEAIRMRKQLVERIAEISSKMDKIGDPNIQASQQLILLKEKKREIDHEVADAGVMLRKITSDFEKIKAERYAKFMEFFQRVENRVDSIYKRLTRSKLAQTYLMLENPEEPYLSGIHYGCVVPGKRYISVQDLSGGEKVLASLPLLFAIQSDSQSFEILDEVDAALDNNNVKKVTTYIAKNKDFQQCIVVSHKPELAAAADLLIGIVSKTPPNGMESKIFTLNLKPYRQING